MTRLGKIARAAVGVIVVGVLAFTINGWYGDYKAQSRAKKASSSVASTTPESTAVVPVAGSKKVTVLVDGVILRAIPSAGGAVVSKPKKGQQLILVGTTVAGWLQLRESATGKMGYVANNTAQVRVEK